MILVLLLACDPSCPQGRAPDAEREARVEALAGVDESICFGPGPSVLVEEGPALLDLRLDDAEAAARLIHLHHHRSPLPDRGAADCLDARLRNEAEAYAMELRARRRLGVRSPVVPLPFDADEATIEAWLRAHPEGDGSVPPLARELAARCTP